MVNRVRLLTLACVLGAGLAIPRQADAAPPPSSPSDVTASAPAINAISGTAIVHTALHYLGYPYTTVGRTPSTGFSCIGFVSYVYGTNGIPLPDDLWAARAYAPPVPFSDLLPGDVLFFQNTVWTGLSHTAIYLGDGRFVHAEWYNRGVVTSSFYNDPIDGDYWISKYLGANRPWYGAAMTAGPQDVPTAIPTPAIAPTVTTVTGFKGPVARVVYTAVNVRSGPSLTNSVQTVIAQGSSVGVLGTSNGWYHVQLGDGTTGWIIQAALSTGSPSTGSGSSAPQPAPASATPGKTVAVPVAALRVHSAPSLTAKVIAVAVQGERLQVLTVKGGWARVRMPDGMTGWVSAPVLFGSKVPTTGTGKAVPIHRAASPSSGGESVVTANVRVHTAPAVTASVVTVAPAGTHVRVLKETKGWVLVQLPNGRTGYVLAAYVRLST